MKITTKLIITIILVLTVHHTLNAQAERNLLANLMSGISKHSNKMIEIRSYNLKPGTRNDFHKLFVEKALPLLKKWNVEVVAFGPSQHDENSYFLIRSYKDLQDMQQSEDAFYGSDDWKKGPREAILSLIINYTTIVPPVDAANILSDKIAGMEKETIQKTDSAQLSALNAQFIKNFLNQDVKAHNEIIHKDFVCIESNGIIIPRDVYLKNWATDFDNSGYTSFSYTDEVIRIFGNTALVRAKTIYTKTINNQKVEGYTIYTDTYLKENGKWQCVQVQITPVKK